MKTILIGPDIELTPDIVYEVANNRNVRVELSPAAKRAIKRSRAVVEKMVESNAVVYGVTTGFGNFKNKHIHHDEVAALQRNLIRSHAAGVGPFFSSEIARGILLVRLNSLAQGYSGVRQELLDLLCGIINKGIIPLIPSQGSVGSSGDLAPLSHAGLILMGEGETEYKGRKMSGANALKLAGLKPIDFSSKEGLAWTNGTSVMTAIAAIGLYKAKKLIDIADMSCAMTLEAVCGRTSAFDKRIHEVRPHPGQIESARRILNLVRGSKLVNSFPDRVQDSYSLRCSPQVHGAIRDSMSHVSNVVSIELNSATDNPLIFSKPDKALSGGNFHGEPIAIAMDLFGIAVAELADIAERRVAKLVDSSSSEGLPMFLIPPEKAGLHNGLMIAQYTAAALVSENKVLAHPASVDSIPTSANQEDHVSMGTIAARKALSILDNAEYVISIELLTAAQGINFRNPKKLGIGTSKVFKLIRKKVSFMSEDRKVADDINKIKGILPVIGS